MKPNVLGDDRDFALFHTACNVESRDSADTEQPSLPEKKIIWGSGRRLFTRDAGIKAINAAADGPLAIVLIAADTADSEIIFYLLYFRTTFSTYYTGDLGFFP
ncbi:hypothetical protein CEXT_109301 [Caerostris extrusa]|uniref:Uncharacterized protein n=1 Tax=Caerostris extrusa TaxID=172846 RepID=A0AAV4UH97_CAEEX|nr:hypothetical protein CEXT_109301 [Caerostris extrusa]